MFHRGLKKIAAAAGFWHDPKKLDLAGLGALATVPAYHGYKALTAKTKKEKEDAPANLATSAAELGGLGLLARAVKKGH